MKAFIQSPSTVSETTVDKTTETVNNKDDKSISMLDNDNNNAAKILVEAAGEELKRYKYLEKLICDSV